jgi:hypothetical protein
MASSCNEETKRDGRDIPSPSLGVLVSPFPFSLFPFPFPLPSCPFAASRSRQGCHPRERRDSASPRATPPASLQRQYMMYGTARDGRLIWQSSYEPLLPNYVQSRSRTTSLGPASSLKTPQLLPRRRVTVQIRSPRLRTRTSHSPRANPPTLAFTRVSSVMAEMRWPSRSAPASLATWSTCCDLLRPPSPGPRTTLLLGFLAALASPVEEGSIGSLETLGSRIEGSIFLPFSFSARNNDHLFCHPGYRLGCEYKHRLPLTSLPTSQPHALTFHNPHTFVLPRSCTVP